MSTSIVITDRADAADQIARFCQAWKKSALGDGSGPSYPEAQALAVETVRVLGYDTAAELWDAEGYEIRSTGQPYPYSYKVR